VDKFYRTHSLIAINSKIAFFNIATVISLSVVIVIVFLACSHCISFFRSSVCHTTFPLFFGLNGFTSFPFCLEFILYILFTSTLFKLSLFPSVDIDNAIFVSFTNVIYQLCIPFLKSFITGFSLSFSSLSLSALLRNHNLGQTDCFFFVACSNCIFFCLFCSFHTSSLLCFGLLSFTNYPCQLKCFLCRLNTRTLQKLSFFPSVEIVNAIIISLTDVVYQLFIFCVNLFFTSFSHSSHNLGQTGSLVITVSAGRIRVII